VIETEYIDQVRRVRQSRFVNVTLPLGRRDELRLLGFGFPDVAHIAEVNRNTVRRRVRMDLVPAAVIRVVRGLATGHAGVHRRPVDGLELMPAQARKFIPDDFAD